MSQQGQCVGRRHGSLHWAVVAMMEAKSLKASHPDFHWLLLYTMEVLGSVLAWPGLITVLCVLVWQGGMGKFLALLSIWSICYCSTLLFLWWNSFHSNMNKVKHQTSHKCWINWDYGGGGVRKFTPWLSSASFFPQWRSQVWCWLDLGLSLYLCSSLAGQGSAGPSVALL